MLPTHVLALRALARRVGAPAVALCTLLAVAPVAGVAFAQTGSAWPASRNVYTAGGEVRPPRPIGGDLIAAGGRIVLEQPVAGDATLAAGAVDARSDIGDDLRAVGGAVSVEKHVGGDLVAAGGEVALRPGSTVRGDADLRAGNVVLQGRVDGALRARAQKIVVDGDVRGPVDLAAERIELGPRARIAGPLTYVSPQPIRMAEGAVVQGQVTRAPAVEDGRPAADPRPSGASTMPGTVVGYVAVLVLASAFLWLMPAFTEAAASRLHQTLWAALGVGVASLIAVPVLTLLLFITLFGIPLGLALMGAYPVVLLAGFVIGVLGLARLLPPAAKATPAARLRSRVARFALALLAVCLIGWVPVAGGLFLVLMSLAGLGAAVLQLRAKRSRHVQQTATASDVPPLPGRDVFPA
jgi:cytoskeletal protein CcmA (bactofilin family)